MPSIIDRDKYDYVKTHRVDSKGKKRTSYGVGDSVGDALAKYAPKLEQLRPLLKKNGLPDREPTSNPGQFRMSVGGSLRAVLRRHEKDPDNNPPLKIANLEITSFDQVIPDPPGWGDAKKEKTPAAKKGTATRARRKEAAAEKAPPSRGKRTGSRGTSSARRTAGNSTTSPTG